MAQTVISRQVSPDGDGEVGWASLHKVLSVRLQGSHGKLHNSGCVRALLCI